MGEGGTTAAPPATSSRTGAVSVRGRGARGKPRAPPLLLRQERWMPLQGMTPRPSCGPRKCEAGVNKESTMSADQVQADQGEAAKQTMQVRADMADMQAGADLMNK